MDKTNIRIQADYELYSSLRQEQESYLSSLGRKISLSKVILHYYHEGFLNATEILDNGLRVIKSKGDQEETSQQLGYMDSDASINKKLINTVLDLVEDRERKLEKKEGNIEQRESNIIANASVEIEQRDSQIMPLQMEIAKLNMELSFLKKEITLLSTTNDSTYSNQKLNRIERSLSLIERQTKRSTLESILPFATPLLLILGYFLMEKKVESKINLSDFKKQINTVFSSMKADKKEMITQIIEQTMSDIL